jgi:hypothetical protein
LPDKAQFDDVAHAIGLSVGAAKLAGVAVGSAAVTRTAVLTRFPHRPPEVGLPSENPDLDERGLIITDFADRVGDPVKIVASDGSSYLAAELVADALCALLYAVTRGQPPVDPVGVTYPVHWRPAAIDALRRELAGLPEFDEPRGVALIPDAVAALTSLQDDPGVPTRGIIAVCDFGATGTSITLADAASDFEPIAATVRDSDLSGDVVDQALLTRVVSDLAAAGSIDLSNTSAIGSLSRLRSQCRAAKERLSTKSVTSLAVDLPGRRRAEFRLTRADLDEAIEDPLAGFVEVLYDALRRNRIRQSDLVAVASIGGGARIPLVTTALSKYLRVPIITTGHPELTAAIGAGLEGLRASAEEGLTSMTPKAAKSPTSPIAPRPAAKRAPPETGRSVPASGLRELGWSGAKPDSRPVRVHDRRTDDPRPRLQFDDDGDFADIADDEPPTPWYRNPFALLATGVSLVLAATVAAAVFVLVRDDSPTPTSTTITTSRTTPTTTTTATTVPPPPEPSPQAPAESTAVIPPPPPPPLVTDAQPPPRAPVNQVPPSPITEAPPTPPTNSPSQSESPPPPPPSDAPPPQQPPSEPPPPSNTPPPGAPAIPEVPPIPAVPPVP